MFIFHFISHIPLIQHSVADAALRPFIVEFNIYGQQKSSGLPGLLDRSGLQLAGIAPTQRWGKSFSLFFFFRPSALRFPRGKPLSPPSGHIHFRRGKVWHRKASIGVGKNLARKCPQKLIHGNVLLRPTHTHTQTEPRRRDMFMESKLMRGRSRRIYRHGPELINGLSFRQAFRGGFGLGGKKFFTTKNLHRPTERCEIHQTLQVNAYVLPSDVKYNLFFRKQSK